MDPITSERFIVHPKIVTPYDDVHRRHTASPRHLLHEVEHVFRHRQSARVYARVREQRRQECCGTCPSPGEGVCERPS